MNKKILALAIAGAMVSPSALAAVDTTGMQYTSASEGFYGSLRARWDSGTGTKDGDSRLSDSSNRIGVSGTLDLGGGLTGFYTGEWGVSNNQGNGLSNRIGHVGLRGGFGELIVGSFWANDYNWTFGSTDVANWGSGNHAYSAATGRQGRPNDSLQYTTPELNGFQAALRLQASGEGQETDANDLNAWNIAATYAIQGFTVAGAYNVIADGTAAVAPATAATDVKSWTARLGYAQDNWYVNSWYGQTDTGVKDDGTDFFSIGGGVSLDKVNLYAMYESADPDVGKSNNDGVLGVQYNLGSRSRIWTEYVIEDPADNTGEDYVNIGLRHDF